jgi:hypothetical protein
MEKKMISEADVAELEKVRWVCTKCGWSGEIRDTSHVAITVNGCRECNYAPFRITSNATVLALAAEWRSLSSALAVERERTKELREALEWYANGASYTVGPNGSPDERDTIIEIDRGAIARAALAKGGQP